MIKPLIAVLSVALYLSPLSSFADDTKTCNETQQGNCESFCQDHQGLKSCIIDISTRSGACTCSDGTTHTKS